MPFIQDGMPLHMILNPKTRLQHRPNHDFASLVRIAQNTASAVSTLHQAGVVIGDMNGQNFLVLRNGTVRAIDCDSMQIGGSREWGSQVGVEEYTAPELQGLSLKNITRTKSHDNFGLAVLLFELLVLGRHPFSGNANHQVGDAIKRARHIFATNGPERGVFKVLGLRSEDILTPDIIDLFGRAFDLPRKKKLLGSTPQRPDAGKWAVALAGLANQLAVCPKNAAHHYIGSAKSCPWCVLEKRGVPKFFITQAPTFLSNLTASKARANSRPGRGWSKLIFRFIDVLWHGSNLIIKFSWQILREIFLTLMDLADDIYDACDGSIIQLISSILNWTIMWTIRLAKFGIGLWLFLIVLKLLGFNI